MNPTTEMVLTVVNILLEDVAEKPERLARAQEIARRDIEPIIAKHPPIEPTEEMREALRAQFHEAENYAYEEAFWIDWKAVVLSLRSE